MNLTTVLHPTVSFAQLNAGLIRLGWERSPDTSVAPPLIPGEPEFASWSHRDGAARISYTFNPVVQLRVVVFYGEGTGARRAEVENALQTIDIAALQELLRSAEPRDILLGILAARELKALPVLDLLEGLREHRESAIARAASKAHEELLEEYLEIGAAHLRSEKKRHPDRSVLFPRLGDAHMRRQTLRWLIRDRSESNEEIDAVLRSGLADEDWEVRASAMLTAVRLRATAVGAEIRLMQLPRSSSEGPDETDRSILYAARKLTLANLTGEQIDTAEAGDERAALSRHLERCITGQPVERYDRIFLFINALTEPFELEEEVPPAVDCVQNHAGSYRLRRSGIELCWVGALPHWLGADDPDLTVANPIRQVTPAEGFFIARRPLSIVQAQNLTSRARSDSRTTPAEPYLCDQAEAEYLCESLGRLEGADIDLPGAEEWEMAARGTDGRRFPWGNGYERDHQVLQSPWGLEQTVGYRSQWTVKKKDANLGIVCGGEKDLRCASRHEVSLNESTSVHSVRPILRR